MRQNVIRSAWKVAAVAVIVTGAFCGQVRAVNDIAAQWTFEASVPTTAGPHSPETGSGSATGFHAGAAAYSNPSGNGSFESFSSNTWAVGDYYQFQTSTTGLTDIGFQFDQVSSNTGPRDFEFQYSTDGTNFTPFASYKVQPSTDPFWSSAGPVTPPADTYLYDLGSVLDNQANAFFRLALTSVANAANPNSTFSGTSGANRIDNVTIYNNFDPTDPLLPKLGATLPQAGDIVFGTGIARSKTTLELVRGSAVASGGAKVADAPFSPWQNDSFIRYVKFDNKGGVAHNVAGNLLGVDAGPSAATGGKIYSFATQGSVPAPAGQSLATVAGTRLSGLSVSPNNSKIAVVGSDDGNVIVYDYTAGNSLGSGASLSGVRQTGTPPLGASISNFAQPQGTAWLNNSTVLALSYTGGLFEVNESTMVANQVATLTTPNTGTQNSTALAYNPAVSPFVYAMASAFDVTTTNTLYILDPLNSYNLVKQLDMSSSADTIRDIALDANGNLFFSTNTHDIEFISDVVTAGGIAALFDNSSQDWYSNTSFSSSPTFNGLDIGFAAPGLTGDYNNDGKVDAGDYVTWRKAQGTTNVLANDPVGGTIGTAQYNNWRANFGKPPGAGSGLDGAAVPEPASAVLLVIGLAAFCSRRRRA